jgi:hypothetical protein
MFPTHFAVNLRGAERPKSPRLERSDHPLSFVDDGQCPM